MKNILQYGVLVLAVVVLAWSMITMLTPTSQTANTLEKNDKNFQYYENLNKQSTNNCGDLTDPDNIQHLTHHPGQYSDCIKQVDAQIFESAIGQNKEDWMRSNGI